MHDWEMNKNSSVEKLFELEEEKAFADPLGHLEVSIVEAKEGSLVRLSDGLVVDPEILLSMFESITKFEEEFGPIEEAAQKLRTLKRIEENLAPLDELEETVGKLVEKVEEMVYQEADKDDSDEDEVSLDDLTGDEYEDDEEEEIDVSDLTVKELLLLVLQMLSGDDYEEDDDLEVDLSDLDLENIGDMKVADLVRTLRESNESKKTGCGGCGEKKKKHESSSVDKLFEVEEDTEVLGFGPEKPNMAHSDSESKEVEGDEGVEAEKEEKEEETHESLERAVDKKVRHETVYESHSEDFGAEIFRRLLERLG